MIPRELNLINIENVILFKEVIKMTGIDKRNLNQPEKTQNVGRMKVETVTIGSLIFSRNTAAPGWQWSEDVKPIAKTESCQLNHLIHVISGKLQVRMDDGTDMEFSAGDIGSIPPGHNGWTVGDEPAVWIELPH